MSPSTLGHSIKPFLLAMLCIDTNLWFDFAAAQITRATTARCSTALFTVSHAQLLRPTLPALVYVFVIRRSGNWDAFVTLRQSQLQEVIKSAAIAPVADDRFLLTFDLTDEGIACAAVDLSHYRNTWEPFPIRDFRQPLLRLQVHAHAGHPSPHFSPAA